MTLPATPLFHVDSPATWQPAGPDVEVTGWLYAGEVQPALDIRARVDQRVFLGTYGLDRPEHQARLGGGRAAARTGFTLRVQVWRGARELALDYHDGTEWREFFRTPLDPSALPDSTTKPRRILRATHVIPILSRLYRGFHRSSWSVLCREADRLLNEALAPAGDFSAGADCLGCLDNPVFAIQGNYGKVPVNGWALGVNREIRQISATLGALGENRLIYPQDRPDVAAHFPGRAGASRAGFHGLVDLPSGLPSPANLKIFVELDDGTRLLAFTRRVHLDPRPDPSGPVPVYHPRLFLKVTAAFLRGAVLGQYRFDRWQKALKEILRLRHRLASTLGRSGTESPPAPPARRLEADPYVRWCWHNRLTPRLRAAFEQDAAALAAAGGPLISVLVPVYNTPEPYLRELLDSIRGQLYPRWELCIADDASSQPHVRRLLEEAARADPRIKPVFRTENGHISRATNSALDVATGDFVALVDHDDRLPPDALLHVAQAIVHRPTAGYLYTDEDKIDDSGRRYDPQFKGGWSPAMALTHNYTHHLSVIRRDVVEKSGRFRPNFDGAQDLDLFLRCWELLPPEDIVHVPFIGYHWRAHPASTATRGDQKDYLFDAARRGIAEALQRRGLRATPVLPAFARDHALCLHQLQWDPALLRENPVTLVIPHRNRAGQLRACLEAVARTTPRESVQVMVVDDHSDEPDALALLAGLPARTDLRCKVVHAAGSVRGGQPASLLNLGAARVETPFLLCLDPGVEALSPGWLEDLVGWLSMPGVGVAGAKLLNPDDTLCHAGLGLGRRDGRAHRLFANEPAAGLGHLFLPHAARDVAGVTGLCLLTRTGLFRQLQGFSEKIPAADDRDLDFCRRAHAAGSRTVFSPQAILRCTGQAPLASPGAAGEPNPDPERPGDLPDPYLGEALELPPARLALNPHHHRPAQAARPFRAIALTHNLNFEGAPIFLFELARFLAEQPGVSVTVASPQDGPLRARLEQSGLKVEIWDVAGITDAKTPAAFAAALSAFAGSRSWAQCDVLVCNTMVTYWGVHLAAQLHKPSALYVHESNPVKRFFQPLLPPAMHDTVEAAFRLATRVVFTAQATQQIFEELNAGDRFRLLPSWVDFGRIEEFARRHDPAALRRKHGLDPDAVVVVNIGTVCERKGQHIYLRGIDLLGKELPGLAPGRKIQWVMVGAREGLYMDSLREDIRLLGLHDVKVFAETGEIYDFYRLADILVSSSFEESFPRVLLEAMVFGTRIVSTDVNGIPEMLTDAVEARLVPAGDPARLAEALRQAITDHVAGNRQMPAQARARAARSFHQARALPQHLQVIREAWLGDSEPAPDR
jgi:glycosyltransferase involved in cell wall biosynthesis/GT2 family glycosyltransferase